MEKIIKNFLTNSISTPTGKSFLVHAEYVDYWDEAAVLENEIITHLG